MRKPLRREFANACQEQTIAALDKSSDRISKIRHELAETDLTLVPLRIADNPVVSSRNGHSVYHNWLVTYSRNTSHVLGTLAMVVLLSLGAPFWFNALRQLSNLKPAISSKIEKERSGPQN